MSSFVLSIFSLSYLVEAQWCNGDNLGFQRINIEEAEQNKPQPYPDSEKSVAVSAPVYIYNALTKDIQHKSLVKPALKLLRHSKRFS